MISALSLEEIDFVSGGTEPFCPDGFKLGSISYDGGGNVTGWTCVAADGRSMAGTVADWVSWAVQEAISLLINLL